MYRNSFYEKIKIHFKRVMILIAAVIYGSFSFAQSINSSIAEDFKSASTISQVNKYPQMNSENRVRASIAAPKATHEWLSWRRGLHGFASLLFRDQQEK